MNRFCFLVLLATVQVETTDPTQPTARALDRWKAAHMQVLKKHGPAEYEIRKLAFYAGNADPSGEATGPVTTAVVTERTTSGDSCTIGMREITLSWQKGEDQATVDKERVMGEDCCDLDHCAKRTAGGWMAHLAQLCVGDEGQERRLRELVDPKRGILVEIATDTKVPGPRRVRWKRSDPSSLCNLGVARFTCEDKTPDAARFTCSTLFPNEHYYFVWRRNHGAAYIEKISGTLED